MTGKRNYVHPEPGTGPCRNCLGTGMRVAYYCPEGYGAPSIVDLRDPDKTNLTVTSMFIHHCKLCRQFEDDLSAAVYFYNNARIFKCGCKNLHVIVNPWDIQPLPAEVEHTYSITIKLVVNLRPQNLIQDKGKLKSALLDLAVDRLQANNFHPEDLAKFKLIEEKVVE